MTLSKVRDFCCSSGFALLTTVFLTFHLPVRAQEPDAALAPPLPLVFTQEPTPNLSSNNFLKGASGDSDNDIWAVGTTAPGAIALHFDGSTWTSVPMAASTTADMTGVSVLTANDVWAVGSIFDTQSQHFTSVIQHFDGTKWTRVSNPHFASGDQLFAVKALASNDVFAVGETHSDSQKPHPLIEHFDGKKWSVIPAAALQPGQTLSLQNIGASAHNDVWVTGFSEPVEPAIMHFDGQKFSNVPFPSTQSAALGGVAAIAANDAWVVGTQAAGKSAATLVAHWDGQTWTIVSSPSIGTFSSLGGISALSSTNVWAVGCSSCGSDTGFGVRTLVEHWNGISWTIKTTPLIGSGDITGSILALPSKSVYVMGTSAGPTLASQTLVLHGTAKN